MILPVSTEDSNNKNYNFFFDSLFVNLLHTHFILILTTVDFN